MPGIPKPSSLQGSLLRIRLRRALPAPLPIFIPEAHDLDRRLRQGSTAACKAQGLTSGLEAWAGGGQIKVCFRVLGFRV